MSYNTNTACDIIKVLKQPPDDLKVLLYKYGEFIPIEQIRTRYVILNKNSLGYEYYSEAEEHAEGAIQVLTIS